MTQTNPEIRVDETDAKAGSNDGVVRWVLLVSLALAIAVLTVIWVTGALSQGESDGARSAKAQQILDFIASVQAASVMHAYGMSPVTSSFD